MKKLLMMLLFPYALIKVPDSLFCTRGRCKDLPHCFVAWTTYLFTISIIQKTIVAIAFIFLLANCVKAQNSKEQLLVVTIEMNDTAQTIQNIGASGCWYSEAIGSDWPAEKKERIAELLFSRAKDKNDNPMGIGLSAWRFNIGGGTQEQGDASGIKDPNHRVECFLNPDGSYDWNKQPGYRWFLKKAKQYGVENLVAFSNTPPVQFTQNGLGYKTAKDYTANLLPGKYRAYTDFLATVIKHFDKEGLHFSYISPVNGTGLVNPAKQSRKVLHGPMKKLAGWLNLWIALCRKTRYQQKYSPRKQACLLFCMAIQHPHPDRYKSFFLVTVSSTSVL
jgi:hypothetical protein